VTDLPKAKEVLDIELPRSNRCTTASTPISTAPSRYCAAASVPSDFPRDKNADGEILVAIARRLSHYPPASPRRRRTNLQHEILQGDFNGS
jgi:hypothetical protein